MPRRSRLFDAAGALDRERRSAPFRRPLLGTLTLAGRRIGEALVLRWSDVDLARGVLRVRGTKTDAAGRTVDLLPLLRDVLSAWAAAQPDRNPRRKDGERGRLRALVAGAAPPGFADSMGHKEALNARVTAD